MAGAPMANMSSAENHAQAGEIVLDQRAWFLASNSYQKLLGSEIAPGFFKFDSAKDLNDEGKSQAFTRPDWSKLNQEDANKVAAILRNYIPGAIRSSLESGQRYMLAELKPMTVCFLGFSGIDYEHDVEAGPHLSDFMRDAQEIIYYYEGSVNKLAIGDKGSVLLVLFGAPPFFHEDDEARGVACALALSKLNLRHKIEIRSGLAAGPLFAGPLGAPQRREYSVIGDTVNLAARLMQKARAGQVWVDQSVQNKADRFFEYEDVGLVTVKGKSEPRRVFVALGERDQADLTLDYLLSNQVLTGRDKELVIIDALMDQVWSENGQILLLSGEAGVGKSRVAAEIIRRWTTRGGIAHGGDCLSHWTQDAVFALARYFIIYCWSITSIASQGTTGSAEKSTTSTTFG